MPQLFLILLITIHSFFCAAANTFDAENWIQVESHQFDLLQSLLRCQGITSDENSNLWFSANSHLLRTTLLKKDSSSTNNSDPFSLELNQKSINHIGDISYYEGKIYAPLEDGPKYQHPNVAIYNATSLNLEKYFELSTMLQPDGVPWVAVDPINKFLISSQYSEVTKINVYDLATLKPLKQILISKKINSIQGGKVFNKALYITANDDENGFAIYKINLSNGFTTKVAHFENDVVEAEGLTFIKNQDSNSYDLLALGVIGHGLGKRIKIFTFRQQE
jgi:hypothetical protein